MPAGDAGDAGDAGASSTGGAAHGGAGGSSGANAVAGEAGVSSEGGAAGETGSAGRGGAAGESASEGGAAGAGALSCEPSGNVTNLVLADGAVYPACRGAIIQPRYGLEASSDAFTCCAVSDTSDPYSAELVGLPDGDGGGVFAFHVPSDAPTGVQSLTVTCSSGVLTGKITYSVSSVVSAPVLTSAKTTITPNETMVINGQSLAGVGDVTAIAPNGANYPCAVDHEATTETQLFCSFDGIPVSTESYQLTIRKDCGFAVNTGSFKVVTPPT